MKDLVSIIIVNYNTEDLLSGCLASIYEHTRNIPYEIIVVDNNSREDSLKGLMESFPDVKFELQDRNLGFGAANNVGASVAEGEYLFLLNPDTLLVNNAIAILFEYMRNNPQTGVCGGNLYKKDMSPGVSYQVKDSYSRYQWEYRLLLNKKWDIGFNNTDTDIEVRVVMGADFFVRKDLFLKMNGFDPDFFMYFEEVELCDRIHNAGFNIMSVPAAQIIHLEGGSAENKTEELKKWSTQEHWYSRFIYFSKVEGTFKTRLVYNAHILKISLATLLYNLKNDKEKLNYWMLKKQLIKNAFKRYKLYRASKR